MKRVTAEAMGSFLDRAAEENLLDVSYRLLDSPIGTLLVAATQQGLVRVAFECEDHDVVLQALSEAVSPRVVCAPKPLDALAREMDEYFSGNRRDFDIPIDFRLASGFRREVIEALPTIEFGTTYSYARLAAATGRPKAVRAVGTACATNPIPLIVPCHRVVRSDGTFGSYRGGPAAKRYLLHMEGVPGV